MPGKAVPAQRGEWCAAQGWICAGRNTGTANTPLHLRYPTVAIQLRVVIHPGSAVSGIVVSIPGICMPGDRDTVWSG